MSKKGIVMGCGLSILVPIALIAIAVFKRSPHGDDADRLNSAPSIVADAVADWFWVHGHLPAGYGEIKSYVDAAPWEWRPRPQWKVTFRPDGHYTADEQYGGKLSLLEVEISEGGKILIRESIPVDLRDPARLWKPHRTFFGVAATDYGLAKSDKNIRDAVAEAVWDALSGKAHSPAPTPTYSEVEKTDPGRELSRNQLLKAYTWTIENEKIIVTNSASRQRSSYPVSGPSSVNNKVPPFMVAPAVNHEK